MRINRSANVHIKIPKEFLSKGEGEEAKASVSINLVIPKSFSEKRMQKFIAAQVDEFSDAFAKAVKKELKKIENDD